jgi:hypothetical protein
MNPCWFHAQATTCQWPACWPAWCCLGSASPACKALTVQCVLGCAGVHAQGPAQGASELSCRPSRSRSQRGCVQDQDGFGHRVSALAEPRVHPSISCPLAISTEPPAPPFVSATLYLNSPGPVLGPCAVCSSPALMFHAEVQGTSHVTWIWIPSDTIPYDFCLIG